MNDTELEKRQARAANETLVIAPTDGGFRVYNPANITNLYMVSGMPDVPRCNCPDFETHKGDPDWRCKHILAVLNRNEKQQSGKQATETAQMPEQKESAAKPGESTEKKKVKVVRTGHHSQMRIKRSISPDGYIDSVSVDFIIPIDDDADEAIVQHAKRILLLQAEIANGFLQTNGDGKLKTQTSEKANGSNQVPDNGHANSNGDAGSPSQQKANSANGSSDNSLPAQLLNIAGMETRTGWTTFINVQVNGTKAKLFGEKQDLAKYITNAGFANIAAQITQGMLLNLPCRVITKRSQDGKYLNIEKVLPAKPFENNGRAGR